jgi:hypothetical protein
LPQEIHRREARRETIRKGMKTLEERKAKEAKAKAETEVRSPPTNDPAHQRSEACAEGPDQLHRSREPHHADAQQGLRPELQHAQIAVDDAKADRGCRHRDAVRQRQWAVAASLNEAFENTKQGPEACSPMPATRTRATLAELKRWRSTPTSPSVARARTRRAEERAAADRGDAREAEDQEGPSLPAEKHIVEPVFGWVKRVLGFRAFSLRGLRKVAGEWSLVCMALNLRRMATMGVEMVSRKSAKTQC